MGQSIRGLPDPIAGAPNGERRRSVRQKLHTPVYASFNGPETGMVVDLSELLDLHEGGFAVQTSERLETNRAVNLCLDLPETKSYIHSSGVVMWSDETGRGGIQFSGPSESSRRILKEWLFANLLIACSNHAARTEQLARREEGKSPESLLVYPSVDPPVDPSLNSPVHQSSTVVLISDRSEMLSSLETVRREVREIEIRGTNDDADAVLQLITERALSLTGASGAALAFLTGDKMICRARAGEPAPPLGAPVDAQRGLSGECVRNGHIVSCEDTEDDPRINPEICRALGIGSLMAAPIVSNFRVVGLLEIFSPRPRGFTKAHGRVLDRLVEMIPKAQPGRAQPENTQLETALPEAPIAADPALGVSPPPASESGSVAQDSPEFGSMHAIREALLEREPEVPEHLPQQVAGEIISEQVREKAPEQVLEPVPAAPSRLPHLLLLMTAVAVVAMAAGYSAAPLIEKHWANSPQAAQRSLQLQLQRAQPQSLADLRRLADQGDAEAQFQMGVRCHNGEGVPQDDAQAMQWFLRAAEQGHVDAQSHLGAYYWAGRGVPTPDLSKAYLWSAIALAEGDENSKARLEGLASQMSRAQVSDARQQAEAWIHSHNQHAKSEAN
jgi:GAF domain-containing protein